MATTANRRNTALKEAMTKMQILDALPGQVPGHHVFGEMRRAFHNVRIPCRSREQAERKRRCRAA